MLIELIATEFTELIQTFAFISNSSNVFHEDVECNRFVYVC